MRFSRLRKANDYEIRKAIAETIELNPYQKEKLADREFPIYTRLKVYIEQEYPKPSIWWRLTIFPYVLYIVLVFLFMPIKWMLTGTHYLPQTWLDNFHRPWVEKLGFRN